MWKTPRVDKSGHKHFMAKEMAEQPAVLKAAMGYYAGLDHDRLELPQELDFAVRADRLIMVACGTAYYACQVAKYWFEKYAGLPVELDIASEFRYREPVLGPAIWRFLSASRERRRIRWPRCAM
jgi:glutamine---fructose-6-phosphate transaminase (isomerizing)